MSLSFQPDSVKPVPARHVRKNHFVAYDESLHQFNRVHGGAADLYLYSHRLLAAVKGLEEADRALRLAESRAAHVEHIIQMLDLDGAVYAQVRHSTWGQRPVQLHVHRSRAVLDGRVNADNVTRDDAVVSVDFSRLGQLNVFRLCLCNLQFRLELLRVSNFGECGARRDLLTDCD